MQRLFIVACIWNQTSVCFAHVFCKVGRLNQPEDDITEASKPASQQEDDCSYPHHHFTTFEKTPP